MATSASVRITENKKTLVNLYVHCDGYAHGLGGRLINIISNGEMVNGLGFDRKLGSQFNGGGCLAASIIAILKTEPGNVYISSNDDCNHRYDIIIKKRAITIVMDGEIFFEKKLSVQKLPF